MRYLEDLTFAICVIAITSLFVWVAFELRDWLKPLPKLHSKPVVTIPLEEINKCHDKNGIIVVRNGNWTCVLGDKV